ncbi:hypothetical protein [Streptomyces sp. NBC_00557]|uniref:hypothetical protein n=1 Tax=Streptomyces sp. NBC_00557 TaxID=2975776 RepID=UPI002E81AB90|nr:hypothetical protein [Streptomyces sp. NBC_00557]WUC36081.1 hypothetical protein OG956_18635 [Streptomyces sp. NBC_00557]
MPSFVATFGFPVLAFAVAAAAVRRANRRGHRVFGAGAPAGTAPAGEKGADAALGTTSTNRTPLSGRG